MSIHLRPHAASSRAFTSSAADKPAAQPARVLPLTARPWERTVQVRARGSRGPGFDYIVSSSASRHGDPHHESVPVESTSGNGWKERTEMPDLDTVRGWQGRTLVDRDGGRIGTIDAIYLDDRTGQPEWALVNTGLFGIKSSFVPLAQATQTDH